MRTLSVKVTDDYMATIHVSHNGIRVFYNLNNITKEKCYSSVEECYDSVIETISSSLNVENNRANILFKLFSNTEGYTVTENNTL